MKTNRSARRLVQLRNLLAGLALAAMVGLSFQLGGLLGERYGQTAAQGGLLPFPNASLGELMAAAH